MNRRALQRSAPLAGVVFVVLLVVGILVGGETPDTDDSRASIASFWRENETEQIWSSVIGAWATLFFVWFAASVRSALRRGEEGPARLSTLSFGGAVIGATGLLCALSLTFATAESADDVPPEVTQTLTVLSNGFFLPIAVGFALFFLATGVLALRTRLLPAWLGWLTVALGILCVTPVGFFALVLGLVWVLVVSVLLFRRDADPVAAPAGTGSASPGPA